MTEQTEALHLPFAPKRTRTVRGKAVGQESLGQRFQRSYRLLQAENQRLIQENDQLAQDQALAIHQCQDLKERVKALEVEAREWRVRRRSLGLSLTRES